MDPSHNESSGVHRRSSTRRSLALSHAETDDDDYDLSAMMVADGFRPSNNPASSNLPPSDFYPQTQHPTQSHAQSYQISSTNPSQDHSNPLDAPSKDTPNMRVRPTSVSKPPQNPHNSLALRNDGSSTTAPRQAGISRMSSLSSDSPVLRVESPYRGPSGPSYPYQMYPQRTLSMTTTSTTPAPSSDRSYAGPRGPTHAYGLYTQTTVSDAESTQQSIPLGFSGMRDNYQRQLGPDGEEAGDLIGPMGHMEELPPYTRYPENNFVPKPTTQPISEEPASPERPIAGAGGIGIATRNPEFSTDDLGLARTRPSIRSARSDNSHYDVNAAALDMAEKPLPSKWQRRAKKKLWGIVPYWAICLLIVALVLMGIIMGATIGTLLSRHKPPPDGPPGGRHDKPTPTPTYATDVEPLKTVPPSGFPIATGVFGLPPLDTWSEPRSCLKDTSQLQAWSCKIPYVYYMLNVQCVPDGPPTSKYLLTLIPNSEADPRLIYGTQPPNIPDPITLTLVNDTYESGRGPAWYLEKTFNKTVILSEETFTATVSKRGWSLKDFTHSKMKKVYGAENGDKPWICTWPATTLEVFIYPNQNSSSTHTASTTTNSYDSPTPTPSIADPAETYAPPFSPPPAYPKVIKMVERQIAENAHQVAFCRQVEVVDGGTTKDVCDSDGNPIEIVIQQNPWVDQAEYNQKYRYARSVKHWGARSAIDKNACGCLWYST